MASPKSHAAIFAVLVGLGGCSYASDVLFPGHGEAAQPSASAAPAATAPAQATPPRTSRTRPPASRVAQLESENAELRRRLAAMDSNRADGNPVVAPEPATGPLPAPSLPAAPLAAVEAAPAAAPVVAAVARETRQPLVVIRFDDPDVAYQQPLYEALSYALQRRPAVRFDLVGVTPDPQRAPASGRQVEQVMRAMAEMGMPAERVSLGATTDPASPGNEVRLYVR